MTELKPQDKPTMHDAAEAIGHAASEAAGACEKMSREATQLLKGPDSRAASTDKKLDVLPNTTIVTNSPEQKDFDNPSDHSEGACLNVKTTRQLTNETRVEFEKGIALADGLDHNSIEKNFREAQAKVDSEIPAKTKMQCQETSKVLDAALHKLPANKQHEFAQLQDKLSDAKTTQEHDAFKAEMKKLSPDSVSAQDKFDQLLQPYRKDIDRANLYCSLVNTRVDTRLNYIRALTQFGTPEDQAKANALLVENTAIVRQQSWSSSEQSAQINAMADATKIPF